MAKATGPAKPRRGSISKKFIDFLPDGSSERHAAILDELRMQTDRGAAIVGAAWLEWRVRNAIRARLKVWNKKVESVFGTDATAGELGFHHQSTVAFSLGLVGPLGLKDLHSIARIRNRFAHNMEVNSFAKDKKISLWAGQLISPDIQSVPIDEPLPADWKPKSRKTNPRQRFHVTLVRLSVMLVSSTYSIVRWPKVARGDTFW